MAYPFVQLPTFEEFIARVTSKEFGCTFETVESPMIHDETDAISIHFLKRIVNGDARNYVIYHSDFQDRMTFSVLRSICERLEIPVSAFGLTLG